MFALSRDVENFGGTAAAKDEPIPCGLGLQMG